MTGHGISASTSPLTPEELEFMAESEAVDIIPLVPLPSMDLVSFGTVGPFRPPLKATVPLWLALSWRRKRKCDIIPPAWMDVEALRSMVEQEKASSAFSSLPFHFVATAKLILEATRESVGPDSEQIAILLQDLREIRQQKIRHGLEYLDEHYLQVMAKEDMDMHSILSIQLGSTLMHYVLYHYIIKPTQTNRIGYMELNEIRPFVALAFNEYRKLSAANA